MGQIELQKVTKRFGESEVIPPLDLMIGEGEFVVFVGPSGCGKSTLLRLIAGLEDISSGFLNFSLRESIFQKRQGRRSPPFSWEAALRKR